MIAKSIKGKSVAEIELGLKSIMDIDAEVFKPTLAIVFTSITQDHKAITEVLDKKGIKVFGATTNGEFIDEEVSKESIAILLMDMNPDYFEIYFNEYHDLNYQRATEDISNQALKKIKNPGFLIAGSHLETDAEALLKGFENIIGEDVNVFGSMAGDDFTFQDQFVFTNGKSSNRGVVAIALDEDKIIMKGSAICGWKAMGTEKTITKSEGNRIYTIDNVPALDITAKYGGLTNVTKENTNLLMEMATLCPLQMQREEGSAVMRPGLKVIWEDRSFVCSGSVPQGSKVKFSLPPDFDAIEKVIEGCAELKEEEMPDADAIVYFTCAGRLMTFGPLMSEEIQGIQKVWNVPMAGMFSNAELGRSKGGDLEMHNLSSCCVVLKEK